jgi:NitT/TauT family transport system substrate-binding protein
MMKYPNIRNWMLLGLLATAIFYIGLSSAAAQQTSTREPLKIALLPILDSLPYYVADDRGYFAEFAVEVKVVPVASGLERDQLMQSGVIDGMLNEMITTANFNREQIQIKTVIAARKAYSRYPLFRILSSPSVEPTTPDGLVGVAIGVSKNTIIEYVTDRLLAAEGLNYQSIVKKSVPVIPERYQLLLQGQLKVATLPDPLAKSAIEAGAATVVADSAHSHYSVSVLSFSVVALDQKAESVRAFLKAWDRAAADINRNPESHRDLLLKKIRMPPNIRKTYKIPPYPRREIPTADQWEDVMHWMVDKGLLEKPLSYSDSITSAFLP